LFDLIVVLGVEDEVGKQVDLVLLRSNPSADVRATRDIAWVMKDGKRFFPSNIALASTD